MTLTDKIKAARAEVAKFEFGTEQWESAMKVVRKLVAIQIDDDNEPFVINYAVTID